MTSVAKEAQLQNTQLKQIKQRIEKARATRLDEYQDLGKFASVGQFQTLETYGTGYYRITDDLGKTICYTLPSGSASEIDSSKFVGKKMGPIGMIEPYLETEAETRYAKFT